MMSEHDPITDDEAKRQLRQGDLPVQPDRPLEPPADGVTLLPRSWDTAGTPIDAHVEGLPDTDPVREAVIADDWPEPG